jgi:hypothetical protein
MNWTPKDQEQFSKLGITIEQVENQIHSFQTGFPAASLHRAATIGDGILQFMETEQSNFSTVFQTKAASLSIKKFTPASGAASRMFKHLFAALHGDKSALSEAFFQNLTSFAFYNELAEELNKKNTSIDSASEEDILDTLLNVPMNYGKKPKALISFHRDADSVRFALEEHFLEGANYAVGKNGICHLHFTVSPEHLSLVEIQCNELKKKYEAKFNLMYEISFSNQSAATNTIAVTLENEPYRQPDGSLLFRPGGHGALIQNLNELDADVLFVKNIDNVCVPAEQEETWKWKQVLAGFLLHVSDLTKQFIETEDASAKASLIQLGLPSDVSDEDFKKAINRPIRVCGMVKNLGEPGGGPFWVNNKSGHPTLQIVEKAQIDTTQNNQAEILSNATHFNPVDLVCYTKDYKGNSFNLMEYVDPQTGFIAEKSVNGEAIKALELPGLWNGAMADWLTFFVEVPLATFNPVKTVNDLLKPMHQAFEKVEK